eukprot:CAMPEP_0194046506 /NCGR_PEP_ID=MMETSP0009_2-20130614/21349_1 /TAXON_ID=210454 /ORGANISM="Grammatophora oceanica, Strain CCMP 410" /LENGTH=325 /DNA_ID=CAMNT_0038691823 /DNA_START=105 /DNA_END=1082 /DNA_ORIENTATION=+
MMSKSSKIVEPRSTDILCGRVKNTFNHEGNQIFRLVVESHLDAYKRATSRVERSSLFKIVLKELQKTGCRFLRFDESSQDWEELDMKATRNKISHAFRDRYPPFNFNRTAKFRRKQYEMEQEQNQQGGSDGSSFSGDDEEHHHEYRSTTPPNCSSSSTPSVTPEPSNVYSSSSRPQTKKCGSSSRNGPSLCDMLSVDMMGSFCPDRTISSSAPSSSSSRNSRNPRKTPNLTAIRGLLASEADGEHHIHHHPQDDDAFLDQINKLDLEAFYHHNEVEQREFQQRLAYQHQHQRGYNCGGGGYGGPPPPPPCAQHMQHSFSSGMVEL